MEDRIREKIENLVRLADRPGTPQEGEAARQAAIRLSVKYGIACKFTKSGSSPAASRPTATTPPQNGAPKAQPQPSYDTIFYEWIKALADYDWTIYECLDTKIGRQVRFRHPEHRSEIRVTQRKQGDGRDFEAEHVMKPDPIYSLYEKEPIDMSYTTYMTISLRDLIRHIGYTKSVPWYAR